MVYRILVGKCNPKCCLIVVDSLLCLLFRVVYLAKEMVTLTDPIMITYLQEEIN